MKYRVLPQIDRITRTVSYDPLTGQFTAVERRGPYRKGCILPSSDSEPYHYIRIDHVRYAAHRLAWLLMTGDDPGDMTVDHVNNVHKDNRWENLRLATEVEQQSNRACYKKSQSGIRGVHPRHGKWRVQFRYRDKSYYVGTYDSKDEASRAYEAKARELHGAFYREQQ